MTTTVPFSRILVPTDFSPQAERAWSTAQRLAGALGAELLLLHVLVGEDMLRSLEADEHRAADRSAHVAEELNIPHLSFDLESKIETSASQWAQQRLADWAARPGTAPKVRTLLRVGAPHREIVAAIREEQADLVVIGTHGRGGLERFLLGSVADRVIRTAPCPVLAVRE